MSPKSEILSTSGAARRLDLSERRVQQLDAELRPIRIADTGQRVYDVRLVDAALARRHAQRAARGGR